jgi:hypothetical protein
MFLWFIDLIRLGVSMSFSLFWKYSELIFLVLRFKWRLTAVLLVGWFRKIKVARSPQSYAEFRIRGALPPGSIYALLVVWCLHIGIKLPIFSKILSKDNTSGSFADAVWYFIHLCFILRSVKHPEIFCEDKFSKNCKIGPGPFLPQREASTFQRHKV